MIKQDIHEIKLVPIENKAFDYLGIEFLSLRIVGKTTEDAIRICEQFFPHFEIEIIHSGYRRM